MGYDFRTRRSRSRAPLLALFTMLALTLPMAAVAGDQIFDNDFDGAAEGPFNTGQAQRFLNQATFGATLAEMDRLEFMGYNAWLNEQLALPASLELPYVQQLDAANGTDDIYQDARQEVWFKNAMTAQDQLRQRVAFALSQILVVSDQSDAISGSPLGMSNYYDILSRNALGNYRSLLREVSLSPIMGNYLSSLRNQKEDLTDNIRPDENYAREILQLFSVGLIKLNTNGTPLLDAQSHTIPTYDQDVIRGFARIFTGWNWSGCPTDEFEYCYPDENHQIWWLQTMSANASYHETGTKLLLNNTTLAAGGTATADLDAALDNIFNHPNVGPFVSRLLIQRLVTSNPTSAYIGRVAAKFNDDGTAQHVRGNLSAVVKAILLDTEARTLPANGGKLREPLLRITQLWRGLNAHAQDNRYEMGYADYFGAQAVLRSPTVFNFYLPDYSLPGEVATLGLKSPEFQITTDTFVTRLSNEIAGYPYYFFQGNTDLDPDDIAIDLSPYVTLAATSPQKLIERYDRLFMGNRMSVSMFNLLRSHVSSIALNYPDAARERAQDALWLLLVSPEYVVEK